MMQLTIAEPAAVPNGELGPDAPIWRAADATPYRVGAGPVAIAPATAWAADMDGADNYPDAPKAQPPHSTVLQIIGLEPKAALAMMGLTPPQHDPA